MIKILKRLICNHRYIIFIKNIYGNEINALSTKKQLEVSGSALIVER